MSGEDATEQMLARPRRLAENGSRRTSLSAVQLYVFLLIALPFRAHCVVFCLITA